MSRFLALVQCICHWESSGKIMWQVSVLDSKTVQIASFSINYPFNNVVLSGTTSHTTVPLLLCSPTFLFLEAPRLSSLWHVGICHVWNTSSPLSSFPYFMYVPVQKSSSHTSCFFCLSCPATLTTPLTLPYFFFIASDSTWNYANTYSFGFFLFWLCCESFGTLVLPPCTEPAVGAWEHGVWTIGPPGKSPNTDC